MQLMFAAVSSVLIILEGFEINSASFYNWHKIKFNVAKIHKAAMLPVTSVSEVPG